MARGSAVLACALIVAAGSAQAFCGFFVGKADANLWNDASKVVMVRDGSRTTINMLNDYQGLESWLHHLQNGALLLFAFFMISDPMTTPNRRCARVLHALGVAALAFAWQFLLYKPNGFIWALFLCVPLVPLLDRWLPGERFRWDGTAQPAATIARKDSWSTAR